MSAARFSLYTAAMLLRITTLIIIILATTFLVWAANDGLDFYQEALRDFYAGHYEQAELKFADIYRKNPQAPFAPDAAFKAGESAFRAEHYGEAVRHFEHYLRMYPLGVSVPEARMRLEQAQDKSSEPEMPLPAVQRPWGRPLVAWLGQIKVTDQVKLERLMSSLRRLGYNAIAVDAYRLPSQPAHALVKAEAGPYGAYFASNTAPVCIDILPQVINAAHKAGLLFIAVLNCRTLSQDIPSEWVDKKWNNQGKITESDEEHLDLGQENARIYVANIAGELARLGPDAIWLRDVDFAPEEGLSQAVLTDVEARIGAQVDLPAAFADAPLSPSKRMTAGSSHPTYAALCEARAALVTKTVTGIMAAIKQTHPACRTGVVLPMVAAIDQMEGLRDASVDGDELASLKLDHIVGWADWRRRQMQRSLTGQEAYASMNRLSARMIAMSGSANRAVVAVQTTSPGNDRMLPDWELHEGFGHLLSAGPIGLALYDDVPQQKVEEFLQRAVEAGRMH